MLRLRIPPAALPTGAVLGLVLAGAIFAYGQSAGQIAPLVEKLAWRNIGPAVMGGRTVDIEVVEKQPWIIYAAIGPSGVWKSENNGVSWAPVFCREATVSAGDVAVAPSNPQIVWVGTGEHTSRNSVTIGDGVYKSTDAGKTWANMGLKETRHISRILINPGDPNIVYVAATGALWGASPERGVFKTMDGGLTWSKVLFVNPDTGIADMAMDPQDPQILYAAAWEFRRQPYHFSSGGPGSGLYKTEDGGRTWARLTKDLPEGILGRIGLAVSRSKPGVVYALIEHKEGGIWRSENRGVDWKRMCDKETYQRVNSRPFYYSRIYVDPSDDRTVYVQSTGLHVSSDMGQKFRAISAGIHPDHHAFWIDPANPLHVIDGNDGGIDISYDGGRTWLPVQSMDLAEVYELGVDLREPYWVYCGLQDNGSWGAPNTSLDPGGIANDQWMTVGGGDGFHAQVDPEDPMTVYRNYQMNGLSRFNLAINQAKSIRPAAPYAAAPFRFNWNAPILISPHDAKTVYTGGNVLFRSRDRGDTWEVTSPDLTTDDPAKQKDSGGPITLEYSGAESHCTIVTIAESPVEPGVLWCGTDDGNLQVSRDHGANWANVVRNIPGLPPATWCSHVEASRFAKGTAFAAFDGHRTADYGTYLYKTIDYGKTWTSIKANLPFGWVHVVREDVRNPRLLFAGTEFGVFGSWDGGKSWQSLRASNLPTVAVFDLLVHPRDNDLIIGTHGRGVWILDDIGFLQELSDAVLAEPVRVFAARPAVQWFQGSVRESYSKAPFLGKNAPYGLGIGVHFAVEPKEKPKITIFDKAGRVVFELPLSKKAGFQREFWSLQAIATTAEGKKVTPPAIGMYTPPLALPGDYDIEVSAGDLKARTPGSIRPDPRFPFSEADRRAQAEALARVLVINRGLNLAATAAKDLRRQVNEKLKPELDKPENKLEALLASYKAFEEAFKPIEDELVPKEFPAVSSRETALRGGSLIQLVGTLGASVGGYPAAPNATDLDQLKDLRAVVESAVAALNALLANDVPALNRILEEHKLQPLKAPKEVALD
jgi:photosystem II stability/assembly factor-like uncharacterized protein